MKTMTHKGKKNLISLQLQIMRVKRDVSQKDLAVRMQVLGANIDQQSISRIVYLIRSSAKHTVDFQAFSNTV